MNLHEKVVEDILRVVVYHYERDGMSNVEFSRIACAVMGCNKNPENVTRTFVRDACIRLGKLSSSDWVEANRKEPDKCLTYDCDDKWQPKYVWQPMMYDKDTPGVNPYNAIVDLDYELKGIRQVSAKRREEL